MNQSSEPNQQDIKDVFQRGLIRGAASLAFDPVKEYFYVEHPKEGWRVYLRACCFIHEKPQTNNNEQVDYSKFLVVKRTGEDASKRVWEPPKGQMEGKDGVKHKEKAILRLLKENVQREVSEEARVRNLFALRHSGLIFQGREPDYPPNHFFQYHIFQAVITNAEYTRASSELQWYREHPAAFARLRRDKREKDAVEWYIPKDHRIMGRWSPKIVAMYLSRYSG